MIRHGTVFILGAGASYELGFPLGAELRSKIRKLCVRPDREGGFRVLPTPLEQHLGGVEGLASKLGVAAPAILQAQTSLFRNLDSVDSIDQFLGLHVGDETLISVGKLAIALSISASEAASAISWNRAKQPEVPVFVDAAKGGASYLQRIWVLLSDGLDQNTIGQIFDGVSFINFNYDRSLEFFFYVRLRQLLGLSEDTAAHIVSKMCVVRPYGSIGAMSYSNGPVSQGNPYGVDLAGDRLVATARQIRIISDDRNAVPPSEVVKARQLLSAASHVVFLGCAFHQANVNLLRFENHRPGREFPKQVWGTAFGIDGIATDYIRDELADVLHTESAKVFISNAHTASSLCEALRYVLRS